MIGRCGAWLGRIVGRVLPEGPTRDAILGDLREERRRCAKRRGAAAAHRWYAVQAFSVVAYAAFDRVRGHAWGRGTSRAARSGAPGEPPRRSRTPVVRESFRVLRTAPGYSLAVILTLGVAMSSTVVVFAAIRGVLFRDLPYPDADRLVRVDRLSEEGASDGGVSYPNFRDWSEQLPYFEETAAYQGSEGTYVGEDFAEIWTGIASTPELLSVLGIAPHLGTHYGPGEGDIGMRTIILSHELWERRFGADPSIVGTSVTFGNESWTVQAIMPRGFSFPEPGIDFWRPLPNSQFLQSRGSGFLRTLMRLPADAELDVVRPEFYAAVEAIDQEHGDWEHGVLLRSYDEVETAAVRRVLWIVMGAVGFFLLAACANVAGLALARTETRRRELSLRRVLGANRGGIFGMLLAESCVLSVLGGVVGVLGTVGGLKVLLALAPQDLPRREEIYLDAEVVLFAFFVALLAGVAFGLLPGLRGARVHQDALRAGASGTSRRSRRTHRLLAGVQVALAVTLLSGSGLLLRSFAELNGIDSGFTGTDRTLVVEIGLDNRRWTSEEVLAFHRQLLDAVQSRNGVEAVGLSSLLPFSGSNIVASVTREGEIYRRGQGPQSDLEMVNGDYIATMGLPLLRGSGLSTTGDIPERHTVVNRAAAELLWPGENPIGKRLSFDVEVGQTSGEETFFTVVGVVGDALDGGLDREMRPRAYYSFPDILRHYTFISGRFFYLVARTVDEPTNHVEAIRQAVHALDPGIPLRNVTTMERLIDETTLPARFRATLITVFAGLSVIVALLGVYGVMSYGVASSVRDIGVRLTLGAESRTVRSGVLRGALVVAGIGGLIGLAAATLITPVLESVLFQVSDRDPSILLAALLAVIAGSLIAAYLPAARASRVDPIQVLRQE